MPARLSIVLPLGIAALLAALFVVLLVQQASNYASPAVEESTTSSSTETETQPATVVQTPYGQPTDPDPYKVPARTIYGGKYVRWNLDELPEGWNDEIALRLHGLFNALEHDHMATGHVTREVEAAYNEIGEFLATLGPESIPTLTTILNAEPDFVARRKIIQALGNLGPQSEAATYALRDFYFARRDDSQYRSSEMVRLIEAMGNLQNETSFELLTDLSTSPEHRRYQNDFIKALGSHHRAGEALDIFVDNMQNSASFNVRNSSAQALGKVRNEGTLPHLVDAFQRERIWYAKQTILGSIGKIGDPQSIPFLEKQAIEAPESGVRLSAASAIRRIVEQTGDNYGRSVLHGLIENEKDEKVRSHIQKWVNNL